MINLFDAQAYLRQNPGVAEAVEQGYLTAEQHFELYGQAEGRSPGPLFDVDYYLASNPDVAEIAGNNKGVAYAHFLNYGLNEGRSPVAFFDPEFYLAQNPDIAQAVNEGHVTAIQHFLMYGLNEPRQISVSLNLKDYLEANPDVAQAVSEGHAEALSHLLTYGVAEGRDLGNGISLKDFANDPIFNDALTKGDTSIALARVDSIAPFMPDFKAPTNWILAVDTPLPTDFVPVEGKSLVIPEGIEITEDTPLPPAFEVQKPSTPEPEEPGDEDDNTTPGVPTDPEVTDPVEPEQDPLSDWTLIFPQYDSLFIYNNGEISQADIDQRNDNSKFHLIKNDLTSNKALYLYGDIGSEYVDYERMPSYKGDLYLLDAQDGLKAIGSVDGLPSYSPSGDLGVFGNESMIISSDLNQYTQTSTVIPAVNSEVVWDEEMSKVWFSTHSAPYGTELYSYTISPDLGLEGGITKDILSGSSSGISIHESSSTTLAVLPNGKSIFYAQNSDIDYGQDIWVSDGTEGGTEKLDIFDSIRLHGKNPINNFADKVAFVTEESRFTGDTSLGLIITNGEKNGTKHLDIWKEYYADEPRPTITPFAEILWTTQNSLFFSVNTRESSTIFKTDIDGNHKKLAEHSSFSFLGHNEEKAFLAIHDDTHGQELWVMDSETEESNPVKDILPGTGSSLGHYQESMMINDKLLFSAYTSATNQQLFISDGTKSGTIALSDGEANHLLTVDNYIFYSENGSLYTANTALRDPIPTLVKDNLPPWDLELQYDEDQIFFKSSYEDNAVYSYNWETKQLEKLMDSVNVFSVVEENVIFGLVLGTEYFYDEENGYGYPHQTLEWFLSDGTSEGTASTKIKLESDFYMDYTLLENATLLHTGIDLVGNFPQDLSIDHIV